MLKASQNQPQLAKGHSMIKLGKTARQVRERHGLTQLQAAERLGISNVHLSNIENNKAAPSAELIDKYHAIWNVDLYILAWCTFGDINKLPPSIRDASRKLAEAWRTELESSR